MNEETKDPAKTPGRAAVISTFVLLGSPFDKFLIVAVLTSAAASTQTTILPAARSQLSMAVHRAAPRWFGKMSPKFLTPTNGSWFFGFLSMAWFGILTAVRKFIFNSVKNFVFVGLAPFLGGIILTYIFFQAAYDFGKDTGANGSLFGVGLATVVGIGLLLLGFPLMLAWRIKEPAFFRRGRDPHPHPAPDGTGAAAPPILDAGPIRDDLDKGAANGMHAIHWTPGDSDGS